MDGNSHRALLALFLTLFLALPARSATLRVGQRVLARWNIANNHLLWYPATITSVSGHLVKLHYDDNTQGTLPAAAVVARSIATGDFLSTRSGPAVVTGVLSDGSVMARLLSSSQPLQVSRAEIRTILRSDHNLGVAPQLYPLAPGERVLAKWNVRSWYVGRVAQRVGEALWIQFDDGATKWLPADHAVRLSTLKAGSKVYGINAMEGQIVPATFLAAQTQTARIRFFDGRVATVPLAKLVVPVDLPGLDFSDPCRKTLPPAQDKRPHVKALRALLTKQLHFYSDTTARSSVATSPVLLELGFCHYLPSDGHLKPDWKPITAALANQVKTFLARELGRWTRVQVRVHPQPVRSAHTLAWHFANLRERQSWHTWQPTAACVNAVFPNGAVAGRHRVVVVLPNAPGISSDSSGVERGMGFVRMKGDWFARITVAGVRPAVFPQNTSFSQWIPNYLSTTIAHEVLHTIGIPHTDGDPWEVMNIGPWYPINRPEVHLAALHKLVLRSPFRHSLSLAQGLAAYLLDHRGQYLQVVATTQRADTRQRMIYAEGRGFFRLRPLFGCFAPGSRGRQGRRTHTGERVLCRAYLASLVDFLLEKHGVNQLLQLLSASDFSAVPLLAKSLGLSVGALESTWHRWLVSKIRPPKRI